MTKRAAIRKRTYTYKGKTEDRWLVTWNDLQGARREKSFPNRRHAEQYANRVDKERDDGIHVADGATLTFGKVCEAWLEKCEQRHQSRNRTLSGNALHSYRCRAKNHVMPRLAGMKLNDRHLQREVQAFIDELATKYSFSTCTSVQIVIWNVLEFAVQEDLIPRNPLRDKRVIIPGKKRSRTGDEIPSFDDVKVLLVHLHAPKPLSVKKLNWAQQLVLVALAAFGGLRSGECAALGWEHVDLANREIHIKHSLSFIDGIKGPKSEAGIRTIPLNPILHNVLVHYAEFLGRRTGPVFLTARGARPHASWVNLHMAAAMLSAGLDVPGKRKFTFHALRHFAGSAWLAQGMRIQDVQWLLGHGDIKVTMAIYAHQLKGDEHARQVLNTQIVKFPGIPHSGVTTEPPPPPPNLPPVIEPKLLPDLTGHPGTAAYEPVPVVDVPGLEAVPDVPIPAEAPQWVGYAVRLLQSGWETRDVAKEIGIARTFLWKKFKALGMDGPATIERSARWSRLQYLRDHGYTAKEAARICGMRQGSVYVFERRRRRGVYVLRHKREDNGMQVAENKVGNGVKPEQNAGKMREKQLKLL